MADFFDYRNYIPGMTAKGGVPTANVGAEDQIRILQQMKMAEMLRQQGATPLPQGSGMIKNGGGGQWAAPDQAYSTFGESLGKMGSSLAGGWMEKNANDNAKAYAEKLRKQQADDTARIMSVVNGSQGTQGTEGVGLPVAQADATQQDTIQNAQQAPQQPLTAPIDGTTPMPNFAPPQPQPIQDGQALGGMLKQGINGIDPNGQAMPTAPSPDISGGVTPQDYASALKPDARPLPQQEYTPSVQGTPAVAAGNARQIAAALMASTDPTRQTEGFKMLMEDTKPKDLKSFDPTHDIYKGDTLVSKGVPKVDKVVKSELEKTMDLAGITDPKERNAYAKAALDLPQNKFDELLKQNGINDTFRAAMVNIARSKENDRVIDRTATLLNDDDTKRIAEQYLAGDTTVVQGLARGDKRNLPKVMGMITTLGKEQGLNGSDIAARKAAFAGTMAENRTIGTREANIELAGTEAGGAISLAQEASSKVPRSGFLPFGKVQVMFDTNVNDPDLKAFATANNAVINTYARAISPTGVSRIDDINHARELLSTAMDERAYKATLNQMLKEIAIAKAAPKSARNAANAAIPGASVQPSPKPLENKPTVSNW